MNEVAHTPAVHHYIGWGLAFKGSSEVVKHT